MCCAAGAFIVVLLKIENYGASHSSIIFIINSSLIIMFLYLIHYVSAPSMPQKV